MIVGRMEAALGDEFSAQRGAWLPFANRIKKINYTRPEIVVGLQVRALRFRGAEVPFPGVEELAALTELDAAEVRRVLVGVRNDEALWVLEIDFPATRPQWGLGPCPGTGASSREVWRAALHGGLRDRCRQPP
jgi:hypothetical protein